MNERRSSPSGTTVVAWTGHRRIDHAPEVAASVDAVIKRLVANAAAAGGRVVGMGSIAIGADAIVAEAMVAQQVPISVILPYGLERFEPDADASTRGRLLALHNTARSVRIVPPQESDDQAYLAAGEWMLEFADLLIAIVDESKPGSDVGAKAIADLAKLRGVSVVRIDAVSGEVRWPSNWPGGVQSHPPTGSHNPVAAKRLMDKADVLGLYEDMNESANRHATVFRRALSRSILLHLLAVGIAVIALLIEPAVTSHLVSWGASLLKSAALLFALILVIVNHKRHDEWLRFRAAAELCRSFIAIWNMPRQHLMLLPAPIEETRDVHRELRLAWLFNLPEHRDFDAVRIAYRGSALSAAAKATGRIDEQFRYFQEKCSPAKIWTGVIRRVAIALTIIALVSSLGVCVCLYHHVHGAWYSWPKGLSILLPLISAAALSWITSSDRVRRAERYEQIADRLKSLWEKADSSRSWHELTRVVTETELLLLAEIGEWYAFARYAGALH